MESRVGKYIISRFVQFLTVVVIGVTVVFVVPRLSPVDPVQVAISQAAAAGVYQHPEAVEKLREDLRELYGLKGTLLSQYFRLWRRVLRGDFGPSFSSFPTPVIALIRRSLPWTIGLLSLSTLIGWVVGNLLGGLAEYYIKKGWARILSILAVTVYPIPYYIVALILVFLFCFVFPWFPLLGGHAIGVRPSLNWIFLRTLFHHAFLPSLSLVTVGTGVWFITMRSVASRIIGEDFVLYAEAVGLSRRKILYHYVMRNAIGSQITGLALNLGSIFNGTLVTEAVFSYPGLGTLLYHAIINSDFNLLMGIVIFSILGVSFASLIVDLVYPLIDPQVQYR